MAQTILNHGEYQTHRVLADRTKADGSGDTRKWAVDVMWPQHIQGHADLCGLDEGSIAFLRGLVVAIQPDMVFETGTHKGRSTSAIIDAMDENHRGRIWTVDMDDYGIESSGAIPESSLHRLTKVIGRTPDILSSEQLKAIPEIDLAFLDGDHEEESLRAEIEFVRTHAADNCVILFENSRDAMWPDVRRVIDEIFENRLVSLPTCTGLDMVQIKRAT